MRPQAFLLVEKISAASLVIDPAGLMYVVTARFLVATPDNTQVVRPSRATPATPDRINPPVSTPADENHKLGEIDNEASSSA
ncbi:hypothetical protein [Pseudomonas sp. WHRI 8519]|uniref:hypothetical protein n=1 Tax=Pseudomonas sp. WHRI 8519 TaxID=3162567 RepID=UPI002A08A2EE|nr:hypothetical protein [Pseudomonas putida]